MPRSLNIRHYVMAALAMAICSAALLVSAHSAQAATCSGYGCDGKDPAATGCSSGAETVKSKYIEVYVASKESEERVGRLDLRYSPSCRTNWARVTFLQEGETFIETFIEREGESSSRQYYGEKGSEVYGNMVYAPTPIKACASGSVYISGIGFPSAEGLCG